MPTTDRVSILSALAAFIALPAMVAGLVPMLIVAGDSSRAVPSLPLLVLGAVVLLLGIVVLLWCVRDFFVSGRGTLAPWDPPRRLVTVGLYRRTRNPMYVGVVTIVLGAALVTGSWVLAGYGALLALVFHLRVVYFEERWLARSFPEDWARYSGEVHRWWPRGRPWNG